MTSNATTKAGDAAPKPLTFAERLTASGIDPFAVPADLAPYYAAVSAGDALARLKAQGRSPEYLGTAQLTSLIVNVINATTPGADILSRYSPSVLFAPGQIGGNLKRDEQDVRALTRGYQEQAEADGLPARLAAHLARLAEAKDAKIAADRAAQYAAADRAASTDPITGGYGRAVYGENRPAAVVPGTPVNMYGEGAWAVHATPLVQWLIGQEVARQILAHDATLAATIGAEASALLARNGFLPVAP